jgi:rhamnose utilization protein RhaD (predicted bifunctional aldolase and dehydrogenase)/NAD(P)-dependent dehydrogenase (short-subunit alcohol dehydrogenase family)
MQNKWQQSEADRIVAEFPPRYGSELALCIYLSRLVGLEPDLVMHGGGNTSVKTRTRDIFGKSRPAIFVKASGIDLADISPEGFSGIDLDRMLKLRSLDTLTQEEMGRQLRAYLLNPDSLTPSVEAFLHAFIPSKFIVHTHPAAILALTNQENAAAIVEQVLGPDISHVPYIRAGFGLSKKAAKVFDQRPEAAGMVLLQHGLVTWGETAEQAYAATIRLVSKAEQHWDEQIRGPGVATSKAIHLKEAWQRYIKLAPVLRGLLAESTEDPDLPFRRMILAPLITAEVLDFLNHPEARKLAISAPLTPDHLIRTKATPLFIADLAHSDPAKLKEQLRSALEDYVQQYNDYFERHARRLEGAAQRLDSMPRVLLFPGIGAVCCGVNEKAAVIARDITAQSLMVKRRFALSGIEYRGIEEEHLFDMEYLLMQQAKLKAQEAPLERQVAVITGAVGAIGMGITETLLQNGCHVALTDLPGANLEKTATEWTSRYPHQVLGTPMDVTDPKSVEQGFREVIRRWGGVDLVIVNAGAALGSSLAEMDVEGFRRLERVNVEGTMLVLRESARLFQIQGTGGDIVLISTKNVFAPGAKFGAYSATKAAAHQLARIASLELAEIGVRVNMVAPDAVFSHGKTKSGLWSEVGPDRMKARGLDEAGLEEYYKNRNLLKAKITAEHVARAVLFFATRQTPTTGATLPVDGGLPDSTPR